MCLIINHRSLRRVCLFVLLGVVTNVNAREDEINLESLTYAPLDYEIEAIANEYGSDAKITLEQLSKLKPRIMDSDEDVIAYIDTYQCYLQASQKQFEAVDATLTHINEHLIESRRNPPNSLLAAYSFCESHKHYFESDFDQYLVLTEKAYRYAQSSTSPILRYWISIAYAQEAQYNARHSEAVEAAQQALTIARTNNDEHRAISANSVLALSEAELGLFDNAIASNGEAISASQSLGFSERYLLGLYLNRGYIFLTAERYEDSRKIYEKALKIAESLNDQDSIQTVYSNYASMAISDGDYQLAISYS